MDAGAACNDGAAPESNRPSRGLHDRTGFEDPLGHRARPLRPERTELLVAVEVVRVPAGRLVSGAGCACTDREDERSRVSCRRRPGRRGVDPQTRPDRGLDLLAADRERRVAVYGVVELRLAVLAVIVLGDERAVVAAPPDVDAEGLDSEVVSHGNPVRPLVRGDLVDV